MIPRVKKKKNDVLSVHCGIEFCFKRNKSGTRTDWSKQNWSLVLQTSFIIVLGLVSRAHNDIICSPMSFNLFLLFQIASFLNHLYFITEPILGTWSTFLSSHRGGLYHNSHFFFTDPCINFFPQKSLRVIWHWNTMPVLTGYFLILLHKPP